MQGVTRSFAQVHELQAQQAHALIGSGSGDDGLHLPQVRDLQIPDASQVGSNIGEQAIPQGGRTAFLDESSQIRLVEKRAGSEGADMLRTHEDPVGNLANRAGRKWVSVGHCRADSQLELTRIRDRTTASKLVPPDCALVVFGSLARGEFAPGPKGSGSDVDWALLVDGAADPKHLSATQAISGVLLEHDDYKAPGPTAVFGGFAFSHELVHWIGGDADTNRNLTRRILLLLESKSVAPDDRVRERVLRCLLDRYLREDRGYHAVHDLKVKVPRFLLNDIVRFWRTMTVDYAAKRRDRGKSGWAIRNVKLRMSRKLIFVAGFLMCISCELRPPPSVVSARNEDDFHSALLDFMLSFTKLTPLEVLAQFASDFGLESFVAESMDQYDAFLGILRDHEKRAELEKMDLDKALQSTLFHEAREIGTKFQTSLTELFFNSKPELTAAAQRYGVF